MYVNFQIKRLQMTGTSHFVDPVKNARPKLNVIEFSTWSRRFPRDINDGDLEWK